MSRSNSSDSAPDTEMVDVRMVEHQIARIEGVSLEAHTLAVLAERVFSSLVPDIPSSQQDRYVVKQLLSLLSASDALDPQEPVGVEHCILIESHISRIESAAIQAKVIAQQAREIYRSATEGIWEPSERNQFLKKLLALLTSEALGTLIRQPIGDEHYQIIQLYNSVVRANEVIETAQPQSVLNTEPVSGEDDTSYVALDEVDHELSEGKNSEMVESFVVEENIELKVEHWEEVETSPFTQDF